MNSNFDEPKSRLHSLIKKAYDNVLADVDSFIAFKVQEYTDLGIGHRNAENRLLKEWQEIVLSDRSPEMHIICKQKTLIADFGRRKYDAEACKGYLSNLTSALYEHDKELIEKSDSEDTFVERMQEKLLAREIIDRLLPEQDNEYSDDIEDDSLQKKRFADIFKGGDYEKYIDILTKCEPALLDKGEDGKYSFVGNQATEKGCVAQWFKYLKTKGIIHPSANRYTLAAVLNNEIEEYKISPASIDNESRRYKHYEEQLKTAFKQIN